MIKKKLKARSNKIKKTLVEFGILTDINLYITGSLLPPVFTETEPEVERNEKNRGKFKNSTIFSQKIYVQSLNRD